MLDCFLRLRSGGTNLDLVPAQRGQRGDPAQASSGDRSAAGGEVAQLDRGVERTDLTDQTGRRAGVQAVRVVDREDTNHLFGADVARVGCGASRRRGQVTGLSHQRVARLGGDLRPVGSAGRGNGGDDEAFDERGGRECHPVPDGRILEQVERQLRAEHGAAQVHEYDDARRAVGPFDRLHDRDRVGAEGGLVESGGHLDPQHAAVQHLSGQGHRGAGERPAVGDDDQSDSLVGARGRRVSREALCDVHFTPLARHLLGIWSGIWFGIWFGIWSVRRGQNATSVAASRSSATVVAPGSWCPTLRSPR